MDAGAAMFRRLRGGVLTLDPTAEGMPPAGSGSSVWGVLLDIGLGDGTATLVSLADGTTSLYTSTGGGMAGGGRHEEVAAASLDFLSTVDAALERFEPDPDDELPKAGRITIRALTHAGRMRAEAAEKSLRRVDHPLHDLYGAGQRVISRLRLLDAYETL